jgi:nucleoside-diphosphate-sugar epimerase
VYGDDLVGQCVDEQMPYGRVRDLSHLSKIYVEQLARMLGVSFASVRLGVTYGLGPIMKTIPAFMTVPNLFCQRAARGEVLRVLEDRPMAFIHVEDAVDALLQAGTRQDCGFELFNAAPEVASIGRVALTVQRLAKARERCAQVEGATRREANFQVRSRLELQPRHTLENGLGQVLDFFLADG